MTRNAHAYVRGNPLNLWDPTGHMGVPECNGDNHGRCDDGTQQSTPQQDEAIHWQIQNDYRQYQHQQKQTQRLTNANRDSDNNSGCSLYDPYSPQHHWDGCDRNPGGVCHSPGGVGSRDCHYQDALPGDEAPRGMTFQSELPAGKDCNCELSVLFQLAILPVGGGEEAVAGAGVAAGEAFVDTLAGHAAQTAEEQAIGGASADTAATGPRGLSNLGDVFTDSANAAGGKVWTSDGLINQNDVVSLVNSGMYGEGDVNILSGVHGEASGTMTADASLYQADFDKFGSLPGVNVYNVATMTPEQVQALLDGPGTTIGAFCNSGACLLGGGG